MMFATTGALAFYSCIDNTADAVFGSLVTGFQVEQLVLIYKYYHIGGILVVTFGMQVLSIVFSYKIYTNQQIQLNLIVVLLTVATLSMYAAFAIGHEIDKYFHPSRGMYQPFIDQEQVLCSICLEDVSTDDGVKLSCSHVFHRQCIDRWLQSPSAQNCCPNCRASLNERNVVEV